MKTDTGWTPKRTPGRTPERGFTFIHRPGRPLPFGVRWRANGERRSRQFATERERAEFVRGLAALGKAARASSVLLTPSDSARLAQFREITGGADLLEVARFWAERHKPLLLGDAVDRYLAAQEGRKLARDTETHRDLHLARLVSAIGQDRPVSSVSAQDFRQWLADLTLEGRPASAASRRHHRSNAARLWSWLRAEGLVEGDPFAAVPAEDDEDKEINILTVEEARQLFAMNRDHPSLPRLALEAFAGLRFTSAQRLVVGDISFVDRGITLPARKHKTGRRHYIDGLPENVWAWLALATEATWAVSPRAYALHKGEIFRHAGLVGERYRNCLRHSFATYHCAAYKNPGLTASILTHRGQDVLWAHYRGRGTQADGEAYFRIAPG